MSSLPSRLKCLFPTNLLLLSLYPNGPTAPAHLKYLLTYISKAPSPFQQRVLFELGKSALLNSLARIDACLADFTKEMEARTTREDLSKLVVGQLVAWKVEFSRDISASIAEVEAALSENAQELQGKCSFSLLCNTAKPLQIVHYIQTSKKTKMRK